MDSDFIEKRRQEYNSFGIEYVKEGFCETTGGFWISHHGHKFDLLRGRFERETANVLYKHGFKVVLTKEGGGKRGQKYPDGLLNDAIFEIQSVVSDRVNAIKQHLNNCYKKGIDFVVLYYPDPQNFSSQRLNDGYALFMGLKRSRGIKIWYICDQTIHIYK
jgi:hypothetical protein